MTDLIERPIEAAEAAAPPRPGAPRIEPMAEHEIGRLAEIERISPVIPFVLAALAVAAVVCIWAALA